MPPALLDILRYPLGMRRRREMLLPTKFLNCNSMVAHDFIKKDDDKRLLYNLVFSHDTCELLLCLHLLCLIFIQAATLLCPRTSTDFGVCHNPWYLSQHQFLTRIRSLFISGSHRSSPTSGTLRTLRSIEERVISSCGPKPT